MSEELETASVPDAPEARGVIMDYADPEGSDFEAEELTAFGGGGGAG